MKLFLLMILCVVTTIEISAQGITQNGESVGTSSTFVSRNSKIGSGLVLDRNGKVYVVAYIYPKSVPPMCYTPSTITFTATGDGGTGSYTYQWYNKNNVKIDGATGSTYSVDYINAAATTGYYCAITSGSYGTVNSDLTSVTIKAQATITAGATGPFPIGSPVHLTSSGTNITNQYWQGPNSFFSVDPNPVTLPLPAGTYTYTVTGNSLSGNNLVINGDFELGNTGFTSDYKPAEQTANGLEPEGYYDVVVSPQSRHPSFATCSDHTTTNGKQMVVNGSPSSNAKIWSQPVTVDQNTDYQFTYWVQSVYNLNPSQTQLWVNDLPIGLPYTAIPETCQWKQFNYNWNSGSSTTANLSLTNQNTIADGNDFALDDIVFMQVCNTTSTVIVTVQ